MRNYGSASNKYKLQVSVDKHELTDDDFEQRQSWSDDFLRFRFEQRTAMIHYNNHIVGCNLLDAKIK